MNEKYLLMEDDCALDAREYFIESLKEKFGLDFFEFKTKGFFRESDDGMIMEWYYKGYILEISSDDPYYKLRREG